MKGPIYIVALTKGARHKPDHKKVRAEVSRIIRLGLGTNARIKAWSVNIYDASEIQELGTYTIVRKVAFQRVRGQRRYEVSLWSQIYENLAKVAGSQKWVITSEHATKPVAKKAVKKRSQSSRKWHPMHKPVTEEEKQALEIFMEACGSIERARFVLEI